MLHKNKYYFISTIFTALVFLLVAILLFVNIEYSQSLQPISAPQPQIVNAVTVNQTQVAAEINKIKAEQAAKRAAEIARQQRLKRLAAQARQARIQEVKRLRALQLQQRKLEAEQKAERLAAQKKMWQMKQQQLKAKQQLAQLQKQQQTVAAKVALQRKLTKATALTKTQATQQRIQQAEKNLQQQIAQEQKQIAMAQARHLQTEVDKYKNLILNAIGQHWIMPKNIADNLSTLLLIRLAPGGEVLNVQLLKSSGNDVLDRSVITAVWKSSPLPVPTDTLAFDQFRELHLTVRPEGLLSS